MKIEFINNAGVVNLRSELEAHVKTCKSFNMATAFITQEAIDVLRIFLKSNRNSLRTGRFITGLYQCFNSKEILLELARLSKSSKGRLQIKISKTKTFHWKFYSFQNNYSKVLYVGSANFTGSGMTQTGELQSKITVANRDKALNVRIDDLFNNEWENAVDISEIPLSNYKAVKTQSSDRGKLPSEIENILFAESVGKPFEKQILPVRVIKTYGQISKSTIKKVSENQTHWVKNKWEYFCSSYKKDFDLYSKEDILFLVNKNGNSYTFDLILVVDKCVIKTEEGNYFIAYKYLSRARKETLAIKSMLQENGINYRSRRNIDKKLTKKQAESIRDHFIKKSSRQTRIHSTATPFGAPTSYF